MPIQNVECTNGFVSNKLDILQSQNYNVLKTYIFDILNNLTSYVS